MHSVLNYFFSYGGWGGANQKKVMNVALGEMLRHSISGSMVERCLDGKAMCESLLCC